jgi:hypothetical protein
MSKSACKKQAIILKPGPLTDYNSQKRNNTYPFDKKNVLSWPEGKLLKPIPEK